MTNPTPSDSFDLDADEPDDDLIDPGCPSCPGEAGPGGGLCEDCTAAGGHVAGSDSFDLDADEPLPRQQGDRMSYVDELNEAITALLEENQELRDEVDRLREQHQKFRALYDRNVGALVDQLDTATVQADRLKAENTLLGEALDEAVSENVVLALGVRTYRETAAITAELEEACLRYGIDPTTEPELDPESERAHAAADAAIDADDDIRNAYNLIHDRMLGHIKAAYSGKAVA